MGLLGDKEKFSRLCRIPLGPFVDMMKAGKIDPPEDRNRTQGDSMPHYLLANYLPDNFDPSSMTEATIKAINDLNDELEAAGARLLAVGLGPASQAKSVRGQPNGVPLITDGPFLEAKEHVGGFWILEAADMDEALMWARKAAVDPNSRGEVREIPYSSLPRGTAHPSRVKK
jgi:hypothetical protein